MAKFKILYVNGTAHIGGAEVSLLNLVKRMDREAFRPVAAVPSEGSLTEKLRRANLETKITRLMEFSRHRVPSFFIATFELASLIRKERVDLVHANSIYISEQSLFAAKLAGVPCICHVRDLVPVLGAGKVKMTAFKKMDKIIAISDAVKKDLTEKLSVPMEKVVRIYNGVDTQEFNPGISGESFRQEFKLGSSRLVGMVGRLSPEKGHEIFLRAASQTVRDRKDVRLIIVGSSDLGPGDYRGKLDKLIERLGIKEKVVFTGFREDLPQVMAAMDIIVMPSTAEPFGRVIVEAMACGRPVIATNSGGAPEIISEECGFLVEPQDPRGLKEKIIYLLEDENRFQQIKRAARKKAVDYFGIERHVFEMENLYRQILKQ